MMVMMTLCPGKGREPINAWLPLYIHKAHWERVKILLKPILGYFWCGSSTRTVARSTRTTAHVGRLTLLINAQHVGPARL